MCSASELLSTCLVVLCSYNHVCQATRTTPIFLVALHCSTTTSSSSTSSCSMGQTQALLAFPLHFPCVLFHFLFSWFASACVCSMFALRAGLQHIHAVEMSPLMHNVCQQALVGNGYSNSVSLKLMSSNELTIPEHISRRYAAWAPNGPTLTSITC